MSDAQATNDQIVVSGPEQQDRKLNTRVSMLLCRTRETRVCTRAANYPSVFTITEKAPTTLLRHYAKQVPKYGK